LSDAISGSFERYPFFNNFRLILILSFSILTASSKRLHFPYVVPRAIKIEAKYCGMFSFRRMSRILSNNGIAFLG
jgi:hypothetical protein